MSTCFLSDFFFKQGTLTPEPEPGLNSGAPESGVGASLARLAPALAVPPIKLLTPAASEPKNGSGSVALNWLKWPQEQGMTAYQFSLYYINIQYNINCSRCK